MSLRNGLRVSYFFSWSYFLCAARATPGSDALASVSMPISKGIVVPCIK
jgi:hypothetical protein